MKRPLVLVFTCLALAGGCSAPSKPVAPPRDSAAPGVDRAFFGPWSPDPGESGLSGFYPLAIGNRWLYERNIAVTIRSGDDVSTTYMNGPVQHTQICYEDRNRWRYVVEQHLDGSGFELAVSYLRVREDRGGLHEADVSIFEHGCPVFTSEPPLRPAGVSPAATLARALERETNPVRRAAFERAGHELLDRLDLARSAARGSVARRFPGGHGPELLRLRYPLYPGQRWVIRASPRFAGRAEAAETIETGAGPLRGWRIRTDSELFGPADRVYAWYGEAGLIQMAVHLESDATDVEGNPLGRLSWDELLRLEDLDLVGN